MYCRNCGNAVPEAAEFCSRCGVKPANGRSYCPACGGPTNDLNTYCLKCGTRLDTGTAAGTGITAGEAPLPGVSAPYNWGWKVLWPNFWMLLLVFIIYILVDSAVSWIPVIGSIFIGIPLAFGNAYVFLKAARKEKFGAENVFDGFKTYWNSVGAGILTFLIVIAGLVLLVVPGIIFACKLAFVPFLVVDRKMEVNQAIEESWRMTRGHAMEVFGIGLLGILLIIAGCICLGVGAIIALMWIQTTLASLYYAVSARQASEAAAAPAV